MANVTKKQAEEQILAIKKKCRGPLSEAARKTVNALLGDNRLAEARQADRANRKGCGFDFNEIILEGLWDGKGHEYECPDCGVTGHYTAPHWMSEKGTMLFQKQ